MTKITFHIFCTNKLSLIKTIIIYFEFTLLTDVPSTSNGPLANAKMRGWEIQNYSGIKGLQLSDNINVPAIKSKTDVLVEVIATSVNPLDQLMTG